MSDKFERYTEAQSWLMKSSEIYSSSRSRALEIISQKVIAVMGIPFWYLDHKRKR